MTDITPSSKRNGISLTFIGGLGLFSGLLLFATSTLFAVALIAFATGAVTLILGIAKLRQPKVSIEFTETGFIYYHVRGQFAVEWDNIQRVDIPSVYKSMEHVQLPYVGIKVKSINQVLDSISPRLATGLLTEQRPLLMTAGAQSGDDTALEIYLNHEFMPLTVNDERYRGVLAMFGRRCLMLSEHLGYHLYIPADSLDRELDDFIKLLRQRQQQHQKTYTR
ncbi:DUF2982 domain-containing protein [Parashewanella curva]|uniref:DUF2982 domain-containing protein n=1 Tax=Parashewanella curva TaxID=2338552 RepID=A0A3L8Q1H1_9GAMM|nr:DUF2982 domain-containing protein [Parashewanella curva]RLV61527.1 DUF2982 domain-containing protein [Parashewanella curva]